MIVITENGPKQFYTPKYTPPIALIRAEREWRDAWNKSAVEHNLLIARAQEIYGRWLDVEMLPMIPADSVKIPDYQL
jgi:hypothetical protein